MPRRAQSIVGKYLTDYQSVVNTTILIRKVFAGNFFLLEASCRIGN